MAVLQELNFVIVVQSISFPEIKHFLATSSHPLAVYRWISVKVEWHCRRECLEHCMFSIQTQTVELFEDQLRVNLIAPHSISVSAIYHSAARRKRSLTKALVRYPSPYGANIALG
jgi:hypothetical protein